MDKLISIVVPVYNAKKYINRCLDSLVNQTYKNTEIILVDDGSKDGSEKVCDSYADKYENITVLHIENGGPSNARNTGIAAANGEYLMFCDSDDYPEKNWCMEFANAIDKYGDNHFFICGMRHIDNVTKNGEEKLVLYNPNEEYTHLAFNSIMDIDEKWLLNGLYIKIFNLKVIKDNGINMDTSLDLGEDCMFILEYLKHFNGDFIMINKPLYNYIQDNSQSLWFKYTPNFYDILVLEQNSMLEFFTIHNVTNKKTFEQHKKWCYMSIYRGFYNSFSHLSKAEAVLDINRILNIKDTEKNIDNCTNILINQKYDDCLRTRSAGKIYGYFQREKRLTKIYNLIKRGK